MDRNPLMIDRLIDDFYIQLHTSDNYTMPDYHFHEGFEIYFVRNGNATVFVENKTYQVQKADILIFNHLELHRIDMPLGKTFERYIIMFNPDYIQNISSRSTDLLECFFTRDLGFSHLVHLTTEQEQQLTLLIQRAISLEAVKSYGNDIRKKMVLVDILLMINSIYRLESENNKNRNVLFDERIEGIIDYISKNLNDNLSLESLSKRFYLSKYHIQTIFKRSTGFNIHGYILNRRILKARELLKKGISVYQVAEMVGFANNSHFIRAFKKMVGLPPKQYALMHNKA